MKLRHFLQFKDFSRAELEYVFARTKWIKTKFKKYQRYWPLEDRTLAMIFEKPSTRTRMSFDGKAMWMRNTYIPLDMLFIHADGRIGRIVHGAQPLSDKVLDSGEPVRAVLELRGGLTS